MTDGFYTILLVIHTIVVLFLIMMVLLQRTDSDGLGGLGGGGGNQFMTGRSAANFMTRTTAILAGIFITTSLVLATIAGHRSDSSIVDSVPVEAPVAVEKAAAAPAGTPAEKAKKESKKAAPSVPKPE